jgi:hypothetical protein
VRTPRADRQPARGTQRGATVGKVVVAGRLRELSTGGRVSGEAQMCSSAHARAMLGWSCWMLHSRAPSAAESWGEGGLWRMRAAGDEGQRRAVRVPVPRAGERADHHQ